MTQRTASAALLLVAGVMLTMAWSDTFALPRALPLRTDPALHRQVAEAAPAAGQRSFGAVAVLSSAAALAALASVSRGRSSRGNRVQARVAIDEMTGVCEQTGVTLNRYMIELRKRGFADDDLTSILNAIGEASKTIAKLVRNAPLMQADLLGLEGEVNVQGEDQKKLDVITNDVFKAALQYTGRLGTLASEEEDAPVVGTAQPDGGPLPVLNETFAETGKYVCVFDPLDGSSNVDAGIPVGTIFGIFKEPEDTTECLVAADMTHLTPEEVQCLTGTLQPGKALVASGYVLYSSSVEFVLTFGKGVVGLTLDNSIGEFIVTRPSIKIPARGKIYSCNEANIGDWDAPMRDYITAIQTGQGETKTNYSLRYIGSMVGDIHRTLLYGGIFAYPSDTKNKDGKLRLLYEGAPMSFIMEQAGGKAITGFSRVLDIPPAKVHQRVPVILGSPEDVDECQKFYEASDDPALRAACEKRMTPV
eukprot:CAMPEP_0170601002 /NCGR_PEP_ID=MMETSP0224-20130122/17628_1 /TAXON_ID=285029 /ORGANISM="Togula jolla, Strain CCCM 725" /LENGTH=475 /DNA_ID=CAMNT_0010925751 /DNA_START=24 /DNA_END=1451 /DNA_ORIENTATION=-